MFGELDLYESMVFQESHHTTGFSTLHFGPRPGADALYDDGARHWGLPLGGSYAWDTSAFHTLVLDWVRLESAGGGPWQVTFTLDGRRLWSFTTTRRDAFAHFEAGKRFEKARAEDFAPGSAGDPALIFQRAFDDPKHGLHLICNLAFGGNPFKHSYPLRRFPGATFVIKSVDVDEVKSG
jgi:hypothetical protein